MIPARVVVLTPELDAKPEAKSLVAVAADLEADDVPLDELLVVDDEILGAT